MGPTIDLSTCCRTCLRSTCGLIPLTAEDQDALKFSSKLETCIADIVWIQENMPSFICELCVEQLRVSFEFHKVCVSANETLQKYVKQITRRLKPKNELFECIENSKLNEGEDGENPEYLHLKHFLDSEEELVKSEVLGGGEERLSGSVSPANSDTYIPEYSEAQTIIEVQDIQEIIVQDKCKESKEQTKLILSNGQEFNLEEIKMAEGQDEASSSDKEGLESNVLFVQAGTILEESSDSLKNPIVIATCNIEEEEAATQEDTNVKIVPKITKNASIQARPATPDAKKPGAPPNKTSTCSICGKTYKKRANLKVHMRQHTGEKPFECKYCEKRFYHSSHLKEHIRRHTGEKPFQCNACPKRFTIRGELNMHIKSHTGEKPYACNVCDKRCLTATDLKVHIRTHTGEKPYSCEYCRKRFSSPYILHSHQKIHTGDRPFVCKLCNKAFTQSSHLNVHMKKHTGEKFTCKVCSAEFNHSSQLTVHKREHTGHQPYKCDVCGKACNYASELETHMSKHTGQKFSCPVCKKQFSTPAYLQEHTRVHTGLNLFTCKICNKSFTRQQYLLKHSRTHTGEKPYSCEVCGKNFTQSSSLKVHTRIHTGERPFSCELCDKTFITSSDLRVHSMKHKKYLDL